jgi:hypothetical protein
MTRNAPAVESAPTTPRASRRRRPLLLALIGVLVATLLAAAAVIAIRFAVPQTEARTTVGAAGFEVQLGVLTVRGPRGVAPAGTPVVVRRSAVTPKTWPSLLRAVAAPIAPPMEIRIGSGLQPKAPIALTWRSLPATPASKALAVVAQSHQDAMDTPAALRGAHLEDLVRGPDGSATLTTSHLSWRQPAEIDRATLTQKMQQLAQSYIGARGTKPDCYQQVAEDDDSNFTIDGPTYAGYPCLGFFAGIHHASVTANSNVAWDLTAAPSGTFVDASYDSISTLIDASVMNLSTPLGGTHAFLLPGQESTFDFGSNVPSTVTATLDEAKTKALFLVWLSEKLLPDSVSKPATAMDCVLALHSGDDAGQFGCLMSATGQGEAADAVLNGLPKAAGILDAQIVKDGLSSEVTWSVARSLAPSNVDVRADPSAFVGRWQGSFKASNRPQPFSVDMVLTADGTAMSGTSRYPGIPCGAELSDGSVSEGVLAIQERITQNPNQRCLETLDLKLYARTDGTLRYTWQLPDGVFGSGELRRVDQPADAKQLWEVPSTSTQESGGQVSMDYAESLAGAIKTDPLATEQWVGCPAPVVTTYALDGAFTKLDWTFALDYEHTPLDLRTALSIAVDGRQVVAKSLKREAPVSGSLDVAGAKQLTVTTSTQDSCGSSSQGYGAFVNTWLQPAQVTGG